MLDHSLPDIQRPSTLLRTSDPLSPLHAHEDIATLVGGGPTYVAILPPYSAARVRSFVAMFDSEI